MTTRYSSNAAPGRELNYLPGRQFKAGHHLCESHFGGSRCTQRELKTLIGKLQFATCVIQGGRCFLRRLHDKLIGPYKPEAKIFLSLSLKKDLEVWEMFLQVFNGVALLRYSRDLCPVSITIATDASLSGFGGR